MSPTFAEFGEPEDEEPQTPREVRSAAVAAADRAIVSVEVDRFASTSAQVATSRPQALLRSLSSSVLLPYHSDLAATVADPRMQAPCTSSPFPIGTHTSTTALLAPLSASPSEPAWEPSHPPVWQASPKSLNTWSHVAQYHAVLGAGRPEVAAQSPAPACLLRAKTADRDMAHALGLSRTSATP